VLISSAAQHCKTARAIIPPEVICMKKKSVTLLFVLALASTLFAGEGPVPKGVPRLDHVFVIMMENHHYNQIVGNPDAPFANKLAKSANTAKRYFAIGHPSSTNYLEVVGGSNFGVRSDNPPDFHNKNCIPNLGPPPTTNLDAPTSSGPVCPIAGIGTDAETPAVDNTNEGTDLISIDSRSTFIPAAPNTVGKSIADQLAETGRSWRSYQESLPPTGADNITSSDGFFTNNPNINPVPSTLPSLVSLYAAKHNPFVYFKSVQEGQRGLSLKNVVGFEGAHGLFEDLASGKVPDFSFIVPNQCNDQHGRGSGVSAACGFDPQSNGTQVGLNPGLIYVGDLALRNLVKAIHASKVWHEGRNAIVVLWDENDYSSGNLNQVLTIVDTNYGSHGKASENRYTHFSLLKSLEAGFGLPCLNHACDESVKVMSDLFSGDDQ
jgi:phosphatidylinositol-3-phosphatase